MVVPVGSSLMTLDGGIHYAAIVAQSVRVLNTASHKAIDFMAICTTAVFTMSYQQELWSPVDVEAQYPFTPQKII